MPAVAGAASAGSGTGMVRGEPWNLALRGIAIKSTILFVAIGGLSVALMGRGGEPRLELVGALGLILAALVGLVAIPLTWISVAGAGVSLIRGNPRAFSGDSPGSQTAWGATVLVGLCGTALFISSLPTAIRSAQRAAMRRDGGAAGTVYLGHDGPGGGKTDEDTQSSFERPIENRIAANNRFADLFEGAELPGDTRQFGHFDDIPGLENVHLETEHFLETMTGYRPPSAAQIATIRKKLTGPLAASFRRVAGAMKAAAERIRTGPDTPTRDAAMEDVQDWMSRAERIAGHLEDPALDDKVWFAHASSPGFEGRPFAFATHEIPTREQVIARQERLHGLEAAMRHVELKPSP